MLSRSWIVVALVALSSSVKADTDTCPTMCVCSTLANDENRLEVDCQRKKITSVPTKISVKTEILKLNGNDLTALPSQAFGSVSLDNLKTLRLRFNDIVTVHKDAFKNLKNLQILSLDYNDISSLHVETFSQNAELEIVTLSHNPITRLEDGLFVNKPKLSMIELDHCELSYIGPKAFENLPSLLYLHLDSNKLVQVDFSSLLPLSNLRMVLDKNPWKCDCKLKPLRDFFVKVHLERKSSLDLVEYHKIHTPTCTLPPNLTNKTWQEAKSEEFVC
jgi:Leucine-rich repeat (LRR) protein